MENCATTLLDDDVFRHIPGNDLYIGINYRILMSNATGLISAAIAFNADGIRMHLDAGLGICC